MTEAQLGFFSAYGNRPAIVPPNNLVYGGLRALVDAICESNRNGVLLIIDEAHLLVKNRVMMQQLRFAIREAGRCGVAFVGETELAQLFADRAQPLFAQGRVIPLGICDSDRYRRMRTSTFAEDERPLVSPKMSDRSLDLHFYHLPITLSNLSVAEMDSGNYEDAIDHIRDAMFLTLSAEDVSAAYLRLRLPPGYLARKVEWEQNPGNVLEASYINLSFAYLQTGSPQKASEVLEEGLALMPSSMRLKHAFARLRLSLKRVDLAEPIYRDIAQQPISDPALANETRAILRTAPRMGSRRKRNK